MKLLAVRRLLRIQRVVIRYRLDDLLFELPLPWFLLALRYVLPWRWFPRKPLELNRGARLRLALQDLGRSSSSSADSRPAATCCRKTSPMS